MHYQDELDHYLQFIKLEKNLSEHSVSSYNNDLKRYLRFVAQGLQILQLKGITLNHIKKYLEELSAMDLSVSSVTRNISSIRGFHEFAVVEGLAECNPEELVELPANNKQISGVCITDVG